MLVIVSALAASPAQGSVWPSHHKRVAAALESEVVTERRGAAEQLHTLPRRLAAELVRKALRDPDAEVRLAAARVATSLALPAAGDEVVDWLSERDVRVRLAACNLIEISPTPRGVQALGRVLGDADAGVRGAAAAALGSSGTAEAVSPLLGHLDDGSSNVRVAVVRALGRIADERAVVPLVSRLQDAEPEVRREAARALGELGDPRATATLMLSLQDAARAVQIQALDALGKLRASEATSAIAALLARGARGSALRVGPLRDAALLALGRIGQPDAIGLLIDELEHEGPVPLGASNAAPVRTALARAGDAAVDGLLAVLSASPSQRQASAAVLTLASLNAKRSFPEIVRAAQRGTVSLGAALDAIELLDDPAGLAFVLEHVTDTDPRVRQKAIGVATGLLDPSVRDGRAVDVVRERVLDPATDAAERYALIGMLGRTGSPHAQKLLLSLAGSKRHALKRAAVEALGSVRLPSEQVDRALLAALDDDRPTLRMAAAVALSRVGSAGSADALLHRLGVSAEQDRDALGIALSGVFSRVTAPEPIAKIQAMMGTARAVTRDALIEALGRSQSPDAGRVLLELSRTPDADDRRKIAEALAGHPTEHAAVVALLSDSDPAVRANAAWTLGAIGEADGAAPLVAALTGLDVAVAGNAAVALAGLALRDKSTQPGAVEALCKALDDHRPYVRVNALVGLRLMGQRCDGTARRLLLRDRHWRVRLAAAELVGSIKTAGEEDRRALRRCALDERDAAVASRCETPSRRASGTGTGALVYVVPDGKTEPLARSAFALVLPNGALRLGVADRRGALFVREPPNGPLRLAIPAALVR